MSETDPRDELAVMVHDAIKEQLRAGHGHEPSLHEIADIAARVFGDACGLLLAAGETADTFLDLNGTAEASARRLAADIAEKCREDKDE
jgi:hypothetical protein